MRRGSSKTFKLAFCGIITALSVSLMFAALIPSMTYVFPALSGIVLWVISVQINAKWALLSFAAASLLSFMIVPELEANLFFVFFFGYYPILRPVLEKIKPKILAFLAKFAVFNAAVISVYFLMCLLFSADKMLEGMEEFGEYALLVLWVTGCAAFVLYDICLRYIANIYEKFFKQRLSKFFRI